MGPGFWPNHEMYRDTTYREGRHGGGRGRVSFLAQRAHWSSHRDGYVMSGSLTQFSYEQRQQQLARITLAWC